MNDFYNAYKNVISSPLYDPMIKMAGLLKDHLGVNHFWYYKITQEGQYSYFGTHRGWNEYCLEHDLIRHCPNIRHPSTQPLGIHFISAGAPPEAKNLLTLAWEKFRVNFNFNLVTGNSQRIESFGFASHFNDPWADQRLLNELPLLRHFTETLLKRHRHFFQMLDEASVNAAANLGSQFFERPKIHSAAKDRTSLIRELGFGDILSLAPREKDILKYLLNGYPASYIAQELGLSKKTVENYIATLKDKLACNTKLELIQKAKEIAATGFFN